MSSPQPIFTMGAASSILRQSFKLVFRKVQQKNAGVGRGIAVQKLTAGMPRAPDDDFRRARNFRLMHFRMSPGITCELFRS